VSVEELQDRLQERYGVRCRPETIANMVRKLGVEHGLTPLQTYYKLNTEYFERVGRHCPNRPRSWKRYTDAEDELDGGPPTSATSG